jgi:hypothetical protein
LAGILLAQPTGPFFVLDEREMRLDLQSDLVVYSRTAYDVPEPSKG